MLGRLRLGWDNSGWDGKLDYLEAIAQKTIRTRSPVLECGSGLTTILLGLLTEKRGIAVWSLEHHPLWHRRIRNAIEKYGLSNVNLCLAPLQDYASFNWYDPPLNEMPEEFSLVICDGPPDIANGGRYGLLPVLGNRLSSGTVILFDDARETGQEEVLRRWETEGGATIEFRDTTEVSFAIVTCR